MSLIEEIKQHLYNELDDYERIFATAFKAEDLWLSTACTHLKQKKGKQLRPILVMLSAQLCGNITANTLLVASAYEMLHTASLVHDDVVDNTTSRRGQSTINDILNNQAAVLVGDYLLTRAMNFMGNTEDIRYIKHLTRLSEELARGELLQLQHAYTLPSEEEYYAIIERKTAILFSLCAESGALSANADDNAVRQMAEFGRNLGICFQIKDDIFDYTPTANIGKPVMNDIKEGKITLPLLHALQQVSADEQQRILNIIKHYNAEQHQQQILDFVSQHQGIEYTEKQMEHFAKRAKESLGAFDDNDTKQQLIKLTNYITTRIL